MNIDDTRAAILWFSEKGFFGFNFPGKFENSRRVGSTEQYFNFFSFFSFFWFFSWWIGEENTFFLDQLKVFCGLVFFMISNPLGEIQTNPLELKKKNIKFYCKIKTNQAYVVTKPRRLCKQNEFSFGLVITYWSCIIILMHKFLTIFF